MRDKNAGHQKRSPASNKSPRLKRPVSLKTMLIAMLGFTAATACDTRTMIHEILDGAAPHATSSNVDSPARFTLSTTYQEVALGDEVDYVFNPSRQPIFEKGVELAEIKMYLADESCTEPNAMVPSLKLVGIVERKDQIGRAEKDKSHKVRDLKMSEDENPALGYAYPGADKVMWRQN